MKISANPLRPPRTGLAIVVALALVVLLALIVGAQPASANHQNCGARYPTGTLSNGHPDLSASKDIGWSGQTALNNIENDVFASTSAKTILLDSADVSSSAADILTAAAKTVRQTLVDPIESIVAAPIEAADLVLRVVAAALVVGALVALIAETAYMATQRSLEGDVNAENACNDTVMGDMLSGLWVAMVERNLASDGPPLAMLVTPTDSEEAGGNTPPWPLMPQHEKEDFAWCPKLDLPDKLPPPKDSTDLDQPNGPSTDGDCTPTVPDGFLNSPYEDAPTMTVQAIVSDTIDHAEAHGLPIRAARAEFDQAVALVGEKRYKDAFAHFRIAYQAAAGFDG